MKNVLLFDADGVLIDSFELGLEAHQQMARTMGWPVPSRELAAQNWGLDWPRFLNKIWPDLGLTPEKILDIFEKKRLSRGIMKEVPGAQKTLASLAKNYYLGLITNRQRESLFRRFKQAGIDAGLFQYIQVFEDALPNKPDAGVFVKVLEKIKKQGFTENDCLYIGDTLVDLEASQKAGIDFVAVLTGPVGKEKFLKAGVKEKNILNSVVALPDFLAQN